MPRAFICGLAGQELQDEERSFLAEAQPWGIILFRRNIGDADAVRRLCGEVRSALGRDDAPILVDQEGGRVQRIGPPICRAYPAPSIFGRLYRKDPLSGVEAARLGAKLIGLDLAALGISVDCIPMLDVPAADADRGVIGDRALGEDPDAVGTLGGAQIDGLMDAGVLPVMKHLPGHGRATADSHKELPRVDAPLAEIEMVDIQPFRLWAKKVPMAMTAHVVYAAVDDASPCTFSSAVIGKLIRERIGFDGLLMSDDISMGALSGGYGYRTRRALAAGCDIVLHCNGERQQMEGIAGAAPELEGEALRRAEAALAARRQAVAVDRPALEARFDLLLARAAADAA